jgi:type VI secretion system protein ImpI
VTDIRDGSVTERVFPRFPVRIGRNPLNDFVVDFPFLSQFHLVLELEGSRLLLRDLGSRNGTHLRTTGRVPAHQPVDLGPAGYEFAVTSLLFQASPVDIPEAAEPLDLSRAALLDGAPAAPPESTPQELYEARARLRPAFDEYRASWGRLQQALVGALGAMSAPGRAAILQEFAAASPAVAAEPDFRRISELAQVDVSKADTQGQARVESVALTAIKEVASRYVGDRPLESAADVVRFVGALRATLDAFFKAFIPLRDGHKQFESKMDIRRGSIAPPPLDGSVSVRDARTPAELARLLLDWRNPRAEAITGIESTFADLMIHQVALLDGVMRGVKSLLNELSPAAIEATAARKSRSFTFGPFRWEHLWRQFVERHSDLADEEKEAFGLIFGKDFVSAYTKFAAQARTEESPTSAAAFDGRAPPPR